MKAVNALLLDVGLEARRLRTTREALDSVYGAQSVILGHPHAPEEDHADEP